MSKETVCRKCGNDFEEWLFRSVNGIRYCPVCGTKLLRKQVDAVYDKLSSKEIGTIIREQVEYTLDETDLEDLSEEELGFLAWQAENADGVVFYSNAVADRFAMRHFSWIKSAIEYLVNEFGSDGDYVKMFFDCADRFLVVAFIYATEHYLYDQIGLDRNNTKPLTKKRVKELKRLLREIEYDGDF
jgi:uncharacterized Zn finger protein (UPF0148 family)